jgi:hypothetical protein
MIPTDSHPTLHWRRSSWCESSQCVEVALVGSDVLLRDSKNSDQVLRVARTDWTAFVEGVRAGEFDI